MDLTFSDEEKMIIELAREFAEKELRPIAHEIDVEKRVPIEVLRKMQEVGLLGLMIPEEYDGAGVSTACYVQVIEELARVCAAVAIVLSVHNSVGAYPILRFGSDEQRKNYLPRLASDWIGAFCLSEAASGSDASALELRATKDGDSYVLNGAKLWVTNGSIANLYLVLAKTADIPDRPHRGISAFLVERDTPGITVGKLEDKMGLRASDTAEIHFQDCRVPASALVGEEGIGFKIAMQALDNGRIGVGSQAVGIAQGALEEAVAYAKERVAFGRPIADHQAIQFMIADMETEISAARSLVRRAAWRKDAGLSHGKEAAMAKLYASEMSHRVVHRALQVHGGAGYTKEYAIERYYRDQRVTEIYEGTSEMQRIVIGRAVLSE
ncbi:MAG: acyl-CoA dehydrogenase [Candidatus Eisenbacteria bacterium]|uniref:Acyl-CoA dehydrogenase n=1 Tax=Eiseniibacteriota bacterium TaxID=2212470 RepID=A0A956SES8_UNCEI|nr:acyl-CoA dehydrogenase [Candidatus Eisenbacteria bacterium]MCB9464856.1 acyl-CoA dehydrogenase [Candidatus Eisenbacteria bacterium]